MAQVVYTGPGATNENPKKMEVRESEVAALVKTGLWEEEPKATKKEPSAPPTEDQKKEGE